MKPQTDEAPEQSDRTALRSQYDLTPFGNYVLVRKLAVGGMAEIYLAKQTGVQGFERNVVIKQMLPHLARQPEFVDMFLDEARLAARLVHPNIVPIYDLGFADGTYFICMEYLPGEDLAWILRQAKGRDQPVPVDVALRIAIDAANGLHYAHELADVDGRPLQIVHRDVSPGNILVGYEGEVKILDFGIAKAESRVTSTDIGTVKGKALYMSPEQSRADPIDRRADVYSLGVTLYEMLTFARPFGRDSTQGVIEAVLRGDCEPLRRRRPELPEELERIVHKAMAKEAADRYATAAELAGELQQLLLSTATSGSSTLGNFLRDLCGSEEVSQKTRIPTLASLERARSLDREREAPVARQPSPAERTNPGTRRSTRARRRRKRLSFALGGGLAAAGTIVAALLWWPRATPVPAGCGPRYGSEAADAIVIGATLPLSINGQPEDGQLQLQNALHLALDEINQRDGVGGRMFALRACDNGGDLKRTKEQAAWLADAVKTPVVLTSWSSMTLAAVNVTLPRGVLVITADATSPEIAAVPAVLDGKRMVWRTAPSDAMQGRVLAEILASDPAFAGKRRIGILYQDDPYGQGMAGVVANQLQRLVPNVELKSIQYPLRGAIEAPVAQLAAAAPQLTLVVGFPLDVRRIVEQASKQPVLQRQGGHQWFFSDSVKEPTLFVGLSHPEELDGAYGLESADGGGDEAASFQRRFLSRYQRNAIDHTYSSNRYDAMYLIALAAAYAAGSDGKGAITGVRLADGLGHLSAGNKFGLVPEQFTAAKAELQAGRSIDVAGASGQLDFDAHTGEAPASFQVWRIRGKTFVKERRIDAPKP